MIMAMAASTVRFDVTCAITLPIGLDPAVGAPLAPASQAHPKEVS